MPRPPLPVAPRALMAIACTVALAACVATPPTIPGADPGDTKVSKDPKKPASPSASASAGVASPAASAAPSPAASTAAVVVPDVLPSLGLLLAGQVKLDPSALLKLGIAERTSLGVKLISNNGPGLISDKGVGLISNNSGSLISNNSGSIVSKTKYALTQAAGERAPQPVQGLIVQAISLRTGEVLAGPIATDAEGRYRLGFMARPESNLAIVAYVNNKQDEGAFSYAAFAAPTDTTVTNTDSTDLMCEYMIRVLAGRVQVNLDRRVRGEEVTVDPEQTKSDAERKQAEDLNEILSKITPEMAKTLDQEGKTARKFAERTVSFADLSKPVYAELHAVIDRLVAFNAGLATPPSPSVQDQVVALLYDVRTIKDIPAMLEKHGMSAEEAASLAKRLDDTKTALNDELARVGNEHSGEVFGPLLEIPGIGDFLPLFASPTPSAP